MTLEQYYTIEEVAEKLKVTRQAIHNWIKEGRLDSIKIGRARRIPAASIERLLEQSKQRSQSQEQPVNKTHPVLAAAW
jgi:excisionase family DNA binding protein